jgi:nicotinamide-nucleotide amidase
MTKGKIMILKLTTQLADLLIQREWKLTTAESCTGGGLAFYLTQISGSSAWFERGFVTYSNSSKEEMLGVKPLTLTVFGAVSEPTAREMAEGALQKSQAQVSVAITGIAGPTGGTADKPVGTVWIAWSGINGDTEACVDIFSGNRDAVREQTIMLALEKLIEFIREK